MIRRPRVYHVAEADRGVWLVVDELPSAPSLAAVGVVLLLLTVLVPLYGLLLGLGWFFATRTPARGTGWRVTLSQRGLTVAWVYDLPPEGTALDGVDARAKTLRWDQIAAVRRGAGPLELVRTDGVRLALPDAPPHVEEAWAAAIREQVRGTAAKAQPEAEARQARARLQRLTER